MKIRFILLPALVAALAAVIAQEQPALKIYEYVGVKRCAMCHKGERNGLIFEKWEVSLHAQAYAALGSDKAREVYSRLGKSGDPQTDPACLKCHITGGEADSALKVNLPPTEGVSCEACHGAGGGYWKKSVMVDKELSIENGMTAEPEKSCVSCHNPDSPTYKEFVYEEFYNKIEHKTPPKP